MKQTQKKVSSSDVLLQAMREAFAQLKLPPREESQSKSVEVDASSTLSEAKERTRARMSKASKRKLALTGLAEAQDFGER